MLRTNRYWGYTLLFAFLLIADWLRFVPGIGFWDELSVLFVLVHVLIKNNWKLMVGNDQKEEIILMMGIILLGFLGNIFNPGIQSSNVAIVKDIIAFIKFPLIMTLLKMEGRKYPIDKQIHNNIIKKTASICKIFLLLCFVGLMVGLLGDFGFYINDQRIFKFSYKFLFSHPTFLVSSSVMSITILIEDGRKKNWFYIVLGCISMFITQRFKGYTVAAFAIAFVIIADKHIKKVFEFGQKTKLKKRSILPIGFVIGLTLYFIFKDRMLTYLSWGMSSGRIAMYVVGVRILVDMFPLGSGFGTFGSWVSGEYYSSIYHKYGISDVFGLRPTGYNYMSDTQWPWIYGQFGILGLLFYVKLVIKYIFDQLSGLENIDHVLAFVYLWSYIILAGCMEAYLTNSSGIASAIILNMFIRTDKNFKRSARKC